MPDEVEYIPGEQATHTNELAPPVDTHKRMIFQHYKWC